MRMTTGTRKRRPAPRSLAGKPLAGFRATPSRRNPVLYGMVVYAIRFKNPLLHRQSTLRKRRLGENRVSDQTSSPNIPLADDHGSSPAAGQFFLPWSITAAKLPAFPPSPFAGAVWTARAPSRPVTWNCLTPKTVSCIAHTENHRGTHFQRRNPVGSCQAHIHPIVPSPRGVSK